MMARAAINHFIESIICLRKGELPKFDDAGVVRRNPEVGRASLPAAGRPAAKPATVQEHTHNSACRTTLGNHRARPLKTVNVTQAGGNVIQNVREMTRFICTTRTWKIVSRDR